MQISKTVEEVLRDSPATRNSDKLLLLEVWDKLGFGLSDGQRRKFMDMPSVESIRRVRQKVQESGKYQATNEVSRQRRIKSYIMQQNMPIATPERTEYLSEHQPKAVGWLSDEDFEHPHLDDPRINDLPDDGKVFSEKPF